MKYSVDDLEIKRIEQCKSANTMGNAEGEKLKV